MKVLDFGLAKIAEAGAAGRAGRAGRAGEELTQSPTITTSAMTAAGMILGTAAYMSPEQAKGRPADQRSDVWAFACVLYEMLTGRRAFEGEDISETLASVLKTEPMWAVLPETTPSTVRRLLRRGLEKDRKRRLAAIADARLDLEDTATSATDDGSIQPAVAPRSARKRVQVAAMVALLTAAVTSVAWWTLRPTVRPNLVARFPVALTEGEVFTGTSSPIVALSPAGDYLAYVANNRLNLRKMADLASRPIPGTEVTSTSGVGIFNPVFSPDGQSIAFFVSTIGAFGSGTIRKVALAGGGATTICEATVPTGFKWDADGIVFAERDRGIFRVSPDGGKPEPLVKLGEGEAIRSPQMLPGGENVLFTVATIAGPRGDVSALDTFFLETWDNAHIVVQSLKSGQRKTLVESGSDGRYLPTGHVMFARGGAMFAVPVDVKRLAVTGGPVPVIEGVLRNIGPPSTGAAHVAVSDAGTLAYVPGAIAPSSTAQQLLFIDRKGATKPLKLPAAAYLTPRVSPDGKQIVFAIDDGRDANIWVYDLSGQSSSRQLTFAGKNRYPVWSNNGQYVAFQSNREGDAAGLLAACRWYDPGRAADES